MNVLPLIGAASAVLQVSQSSATVPSDAAKERFAALLDNPEAVSSPDALLAAQMELTKVTVGADLTAKVAGLLTQTVNKLVSMQ
ncbi:type III secretion system inner rod subunit SctI [Caballeronia sp. EK]|uniref:type III secretion system inner rod subunit SctI n=1 Tax=Caballeronia sp. EK TaxID=2767469 RepID=UPI001655B33A|nr:type III secretion system inner rod subunit SctI [Caballeronia sp. EK]MBC8642802.1 type III secretion system inner rod subunit SctI [Caballeronia sp. EK]